MLIGLLIALSFTFGRQKGDSGKFFSNEDNVRYTDKEGRGPHLTFLLASYRKISKDEGDIDMSAFFAYLSNTLKAQQAMMKIANSVCNSTGQV
jgi:hypothetical protein